MCIRENIQSVLKIYSNEQKKTFRYCARLNCYVSHIRLITDFNKTLKPCNSVSKTV